MLGFTVCHHSARLVMPNSDPRYGFFYPTLTLMVDIYNLKEFLSHFKSIPFACFLVKYLGYDGAMIIGPFPLHFECGWCGHPVFTSIGPFLFDPGSPSGPLPATDLWSPFFPVWPSLGDPNRQFVQ